MERIHNFTEPDKAKTICTLPIMASNKKQKAHCIIGFQKIETDKGIYLASWSKTGKFFIFPGKVDEITHYQTEPNQPEKSFNFPKR